MSNLLSDKRRSEELALAREAYAKAKKKASTTLLRWKPDWEAAARFYRESVKHYRLSGDHVGCVQAMRESAIAHKEIGSLHTAAADLEAAATMTRDELHDARAAADLMKESAALYRAHGSSHDKSAAMLVRAAETIGDEDLKEGVELMKQACAVFEEEQRGVFHDATFKKAIAFCVSRGKYNSARGLMKRQIAICLQHLNPFESDIYKNYLSMIVLALHQNQPGKAKDILSEAEGVERFHRSDECAAAMALISAWEDGDGEKWSEALKRNVFKYLINPVAVIARKLKMPDGAGQGKPKILRKEELEEDEEEEEGAAASAAASGGKKGEDDEADEEEEDEGEIDLR